MPIQALEKVFTGSHTVELRNFQQEGDSARVSKVNTTTKYDGASQQWITMVDMEITNYEPADRLAEFATSFSLPQGCWVSDYYLYVGDRKEPGILAEKRSAMWIYTQITSERRDPGILFYTGGNRIAFRVFPFIKGETRRTGIEFIHKEPVKITIDGKIIQLGDASVPGDTAITRSAANNVEYIPAAVKAKLPMVKREPYYHFMVDMSAGKEQQEDTFIANIEALLEKNLVPRTNAKMSFVNWRTETIDMTGDWKQRLKDHKHEGGYYLDRAIRKTLYHSYTTPGNSYPVIVAVTDKMHEAIIEKDLSDMQAAYPDADVFYHLDGIAMLRQHRFSLTPKQPTSDSNTIRPASYVYAYPGANKPIAYLPADSAASLVIKQLPIQVEAKDIKEKDWQTAMLLQADATSAVFHPGTKDGNWHEQVKHSFISKILTPVTSYIVVENEAQKAMLLKKQQQVLSGNRNLDPGEDTARMSEPAWWLVMLVGSALLWWRKRRDNEQGILNKE